MNYPLPIGSLLSIGVTAALMATSPARDVNWLHAHRPVTRAEVAAFVYQALVREGQAEPLSAAPYVADSPDAPWSTTPIATIPDPAQQISLSRGSTRLATLSPAGDAIRIWHGRTGAAVTEILAGSTTRFHAVAVSHDGTQVAAIAQSVTDNDLKLSLWDVETGKQCWQRSLGTAQDSSSYASRLAFQPGDGAIFSQVHSEPGPHDRTEEVQLQLHDAATGDWVQSLPPYPTVKYRQFVFSPDGAWLAGYGWSPMGATSDPFPALEEIIDIWQVETGARDRTLRPIAADLSFVHMVFTASDSLQVLSQHLYDTRLDTWNVGTGELSGPAIAVPFIDRQDGLTRLSPDGEHYFVRGDVAGTRLINMPQKTVTYLGGRATSAMFDATGQYLAIATQDTVTIFARSDATTP